VSRTPAFRGVMFLTTGTGAGRLRRSLCMHGANVQFGVGLLRGGVLVSRLGGYEVLAWYLLPEPCELARARCGLTGATDVRFTPGKAGATGGEDGAPAMGFEPRGEDQGVKR
jgi:hypothetical protein